MACRHPLNRLRPDPYDPRGSVCQDCGGAINLRLPDLKRDPTPSPTPGPRADERDVLVTEPESLSVGTLNRVVRDLRERLHLATLKAQAPTPGPDARAPEETRGEESMRLVLGALTNAVGVLLDLPVGNRYEEEALAQLKREWTRADAFLCGACAPSYEGLRRAAERVVNEYRIDLHQPEPKWSDALLEAVDDLREILSSTAPDPEATGCTFLDPYGNPCDLPGGHAGYIHSGTSADGKFKWWWTPSGSVADGKCPKCGDDIGEQLAIAYDAGAESKDAQAPGEAGHTRGRTAEPAAERGEQSAPSGVAGAPSDEGLRRAAERALEHWATASSDAETPGWWLRWNEALAALRSSLPGDPEAGDESPTDEPRCECGHARSVHTDMCDADGCLCAFFRFPPIAPGQSITDYVRRFAPPARPTIYRDSDVGAAVHRGVEAAARVLAGQGIDTRGKLDLSGEVKDEIAQILAARAEGPREEEPDLLAVLGDLWRSAPDVVWLTQHVGPDVEQREMVKAYAAAMAAAGRVLVAAGRLDAPAPAPSRGPETAPGEGT